MLGTARVEPLIRRIRNGMAGAGMRVENSKGECNFGQHEINFRFGDALQAADEHAIYKNGAKEIAAQDGKAISFMAKFDEREGNSCHVHLSARRNDGSALFVDEPETFDPFLAGQLACLRELTLRSRRTSTRTSATPRSPSPPRSSPGARTTGRARCASWATATPGASSAARPAPT
jgi:glutamine synthetase